MPAAQPRRLLIMRHAKSDWATGVEDYDRPLNDRGQRDVPLVARFLAGSAPPELVLASAARRARETADLLVEALSVPPELILEEQLYLAPPETLAAVLSAAGDGVKTVVVVAHNPGVEEWASRLCGAAIHMPPGAVACLESDADRWADTTHAASILRWHITPKLLKKTTP